MSADPTLGRSPCFVAGFMSNFLKPGSTCCNAETATVCEKSASHPCIALR